MLKLIKSISERGHDIGLHASYSSYNCKEQLVRERKLLINACHKVGISVSVDGSRQHYLRWDASETPDHLDDVGFSYDSTGGFADIAGFRFGTSRPFSMWSWLRSSPLKLIQRPLIVMECSVIAVRYQGLGYTDAALDLMLRLKSLALEHGGDFNFLWHNSHLVTEKDREFFTALLR